MWKRTRLEPKWLRIDFIHAIVQTSLLPSVGGAQPTHVKGALRYLGLKTVNTTGVEGVSRYLIFVDTTLIIQVCQTQPVGHVFFMAGMHGGKLLSQQGCAILEPSVIHKEPGADMGMGMGNVCIEIAS